VRIERGSFALLATEFRDWILTLDRQFRARRHDYAKIRDSLHDILGRHLRERVRVLFAMKHRDNNSDRTGERSIAHSRIARIMSNVDYWYH